MTARHNVGRFVVVLVASLISSTGVASAAGSWYVTSAGSDANACASPAAACATITAAIGKASQGDTVNVADGTYTGAGAQVVLVDRSVTLEGGWNATFTSRGGASIIDGGGERRGIVVDTAAPVTVDGFVVQHGAPGPSQISAGGIYNLGATLTVRNSRIVDNTAADGAGIKNCNVGDLRLVRSTVSGNQAYGSGGGISSCATATTTIVESTVSGNTATIRGGAIEYDSATVNIRNSTVSGNTSGWEGGGVYLTGNNAILRVSSSTIVRNSAGATFTGGGIFVGGGVASNVTLRNSILAGNSASSSPDCRSVSGSPVASAGHNIVGTTSGCEYTAHSSDLLGVDPLLGALADNGGPSRTHALRPGSPANDRGNTGGCVDDAGTPLAADQRGVARPLGDACDIGAFEAAPPANDAFDAGINLNGFASPLAASNAFATKQPGEPDHGDDEGGSSIWFAWTPPFAGIAYVSTAGSDFDTLIGVYTGSTMSSLATVAQNDDVNTALRTSKACFTASAGTVHRIAVDGFQAFAGGSDTEGSVTLAWGQYTSSDPCAMLPPTISGTPTVGQPLSASTGTWAGTPSGFTYGWVACDVDECFGIDGETASTYTPAAEAEGYVLYVRVTAEHPSDPARSAIAYSDVTNAVAPAPPPPPPAPPPPPPPGPPAPPQPPTDTAAPSLVLSGATSQRIARRRAITVVVSCPGEACTAAAQATVVVRGSTKSPKLEKVTKRVAAGSRTTMKLTIGRSVLRAITRALKAGKHVSARVNVTATDAAGNATTRRRTIRLKR